MTFQLELESNKLKEPDFSTFVNLYPNLEKLRVSGNPLKDISLFKPLSSLKNLRKLEYLECFKNDRRDDVFKLIGSLEVVNKHSKTNEEVESTIDIEGNYNIFILIIFQKR